MPVTGPDRRYFLALLAALPLAAEEKLPDFFARLATALSGGDPEAFLRGFDPNMPGYAELSRNVRELLAATGGVGSSVEILEVKDRSVRLNWALEIEGTRRQRDVVCTVERRGRSWRITALEPISFFAKNPGQYTQTPFPKSNFSWRS